MQETQSLQNDAQTAASPTPETKPLPQPSSTEIPKPKDQQFTKPPKPLKILKIPILIVLCIMILLVLGTAAYLYFQKPEPVKCLDTQESCNPQSCDYNLEACNKITANWKTFENKPHGYSIKYPPEKFSPCNQNNYFLLLKGAEGSIDCESISTTSSQIIITVNKVVPDWLERYQNPCLSVYENFPVANISAKKFHSSENCNDAPPVIYPKGSIFIVFENNNSFYEITYIEDQEAKIKNQILSTFKFIEKQQPTTTPIPQSKDGCKIDGCNNELCLDPNVIYDIYSPCIAKPEYECYKTAKCEKQTNGHCGWTTTEELANCLVAKQEKPNEPIQPPSSTAQKCKEKGGTWLEKYSECEAITSQQCSELAGDYNECASACRHDPPGGSCIEVCIQVCKH